MLFTPFKKERGYKLSDGLWRPCQCHGLEYNNKVKQEEGKEIKVTYASKYIAGNF